MKLGKHIGFLFLLLITISCKTNNPEVVAWVNNHAITKSELKHWMLLEKANVFNYFHRKHGVNDNENFWTQKLGDEIPIKKLKETALKQAKRCKVQQIIALKKGIIETTNFDKIIGELEIVNTERNQKVERGEPVYGPVQFTSRTYFSHIFDKMQIELKNELAKKELKPTQHYLQNMTQKYPEANKDITGFLSMQYVDNNYDNYFDSLTNTFELKINKSVFKTVSLN